MAWPAASVIVPAREEAEALPRTLDSLADQRLARGQRTEVVVVAAGTDTVAVARDHPVVDRVLVDEVRAGPGPARNRGAVVASAPVLCFTDADTVVPPEWVRAHLANYADLDVVGVGGPVRPLDGGLLDRVAFRLLSDWWYRLSWAVGFVQQSGNNCSVRRSAFEALEGFDEDLGYLEDTDLSLRLRARGRIVYETQAPVSTSVRRQRRVGYFGLFWRYLVGYLSYVCVGRVPGRGYFSR